MLSRPRADRERAEAQATKAVIKLHHMWTQSPYRDLTVTPTWISSSPHSDLSCHHYLIKIPTERFAEVTQLTYAS